MKKIVFILLLIIPFSFVYASGISVNTNTLSLKEGSSETFTINATSCAGRVDILSSNSGIVDVSSSSEFLDNNQVKIKVTAKSEGNATISIRLTDVSSYELEQLSGTKTIVVNVLKDDNKTNEPINPINNQNQFNVTKFEIVGYNIEFDTNKYEYDLNIDKEQKELYLLIEGDNITSSINGEINIENINQLNIKLSNGDEQRDYVINLIRENDNNKIIENSNNNNLIPYIIISFVILDIILVILIVIRNHKNKKIGQ